MHYSGLSMLLYLPKLRLLIVTPLFSGSHKGLVHRLCVPSMFNLS